jgi:alpha-L-fucosidase
MLVAMLALAGFAAAFDPYARMQFPNVRGLALFDAAKFGLFVHWGPVSQWGTEISFPLVCTSFPCDVSGPGNVRITMQDATELAAHRTAYADLAKTFNPVAFDAAKLASIAYGAGFRYVTYTAEHCDGFSGWNATQNRAYSSVTTPFGRDIVGEMLPAFRAAGLRAGVYVCPSTWNNDLYWAPNALTSFGDCCSPNYSPLDPAYASVWANYTAYLHTQVTELATQYAPDHYWFDSGTSSTVDTRLEQLVPLMRAMNPDVVLQVRDGGAWHDYIEPGDHSEAVVDAILDLTYARAGDKFEVPGTLGEQWAFDPKATYKSALTVVRNVIPIVSKGGNYLMNIGLDSTGVWAPEALVTLANLTSWFAFCSEAIHGTNPTWPYEFDSVYYTASSSSPYTYALFWDGWTGDTLLLSPYKPATLKSAPLAVRRLTAEGPVTLQWTIDDSGVRVNVSGILPPASGPASFTTFLKVYNASSVDRAPCATRDCSVYTSDAYVSEGVEGSCPVSAPANGEATVPIKLYYNGGTDNAGALAAPADGQTWEEVDTECLTYVNDGAGRVPLELWRNAALGDYWTLASSASRATAVAAGYTKVAALGYLDGSVPAPSPAMVESYAYVLRLEWE